MKRRNLTPQILAALRDTPVVFLQGPRGKEFPADAGWNKFEASSAKTLAVAGK